MHVCPAFGEDTKSIVFAPDELESIRHMLATEMFSSSMLLKRVELEGSRQQKGEHEKTTTTWG